MKNTDGLTKRSHGCVLTEMSNGLWTIEKAFIYKPVIVQLLAVPIIEVVGSLCCIKNLVWVEGDVAYPIWFCIMQFNAFTNTYMLYYSYNKQL